MTKDDWKLSVQREQGQWEEQEQEVGGNAYLLFCIRKLGNSYLESLQGQIGFSQFILAKPSLYTWHFYTTSPSQLKFLCNPFHIHSKAVISINLITYLFPADSSFFVLYSRHPCLWIILPLFLSPNFFLPQLSTNLAGICLKCKIPTAFPQGTKKYMHYLITHFPYHPSVVFNLWNLICEHFKT